MNLKTNSDQEIMKRDKYTTDEWRCEKCRKEGRSRSFGSKTSMERHVFTIHGLLKPSLHVLNEKLNNIIQH